MAKFCRYCLNNGGALEGWNQREHFPPPLRPDRVKWMLSWCNWTNMFSAVSVPATKVFTFISLLNVKCLIFCSLALEFILCFLPLKVSISNSLKSFSRPLLSVVVFTSFITRKLTLFRLGFFGRPWTGEVASNAPPPPSPPFLKNYRRYKHETCTNN